MMIANPTLQTKQCSQCHENKLPQEFHSHCRRKDGLNSYCKPCEARIKTLRLEKDPELIKRAHRNYNKKHPGRAEQLRRKSRKQRALVDPNFRMVVERRYLYGIEDTTYKQLRAFQHNRCAICFSVFNEKVRRLAPCIDHNHSTELVRGILCLNCNNALGFFRDSIPRLKSAIKYLQKQQTAEEGENETAKT